MKQYLKTIKNHIKHGLGKKEKDTLQSHQVNQVVLVVMDKKSPDEHLFSEIIGNYPKRLILLGSNMREVKRIEQELKLAYLKLNLECLVDEQPFSVGLEKLREQYHPDLVISMQEGAIEYLVA